MRRQAGGPALNDERRATGEQVLGNLIADAQLAATRTPARAAPDRLHEPGGVRADLVPAADGGISFGQLFASQPFANMLVVKS